MRDRSTATQGESLPTHTPHPPLPPPPPPPHPPTPLPPPHGLRPGPTPCQHQSSLSPLAHARLQQPRAFRHFDRGYTRVFAPRTFPPANPCSPAQPALKEHRASPRKDPLIDPKATGARRLVANTIPSTDPSDGHGDRGALPAVPAKTFDRSGQGRAARLRGVWGPLPAGERGRLLAKLSRLITNISTSLPRSRPGTTGKR